ncbi:hypothetical protein RN001_015292 [Aquatica leii]|uniref:Uncharacterized protein n=1 Tax=Aquatica leii TaxID=1421715 RepID=A0AAN7P1L5_9COLE|nr:hypothetical protein RN001_015292 [Aquatica leii]
MHFKVLVIFAAIAAAKAGYLTPGLRYAAPAISYAAPALSYAAPAVARVEHLAPSYSLHKSEVYTAPLLRTAHIAPAVHAVAPAPLIAAPAAPLLRTGYLGHSFGYAAAPAAIGFAGAAPLPLARYGAW